MTLSQFDLISMPQQNFTYIRREGTVFFKSYIHLTSYSIFKSFIIILNYIEKRVNDEQRPVIKVVLAAMAFSAMYIVQVHDISSLNICLIVIVLFT